MLALLLRRGGSQAAGQLLPQGCTPSVAAAAAAEAEAAAALRQRLRQASCGEAARRLASTAAGGGGAAAEAQLAAAVRKARWLALPVGGLAGLFGSLVGVGGGVLIVPAIVNACKSIPQRLVSGTSLVAVVSTALASSATYAQSGLVDPTAALLISPAAMLAAPFGARYTARLDCAALRRALGYFLLAVAPLVPLKAFLLQRLDKQEPEHSNSGSSGGESAGQATAPDGSSQPAAAEGQCAIAGSAAPSSIASWAAWQPQAALAAVSPATAAAMCATGLVAGFASGLLGIGGGTIVTPMLALLAPYSQATVLGTSLLAMIPPSLAALVQHHRLGNVDYRMAAGLALGTALGGTLGSNAAVHAPPGALETAFTLGMLFLGRKTLQSARR